MQGPDADADIEGGAGGDVQRQRGQLEFDLGAGMLVAEFGDERRDVCSPEADAGVDADAADEFAVLAERIFEFGELGGDDRRSPRGRGHPGDD